MRKGCRGYWRRVIWKIRSSGKLKEWKRGCVNGVVVVLRYSRSDVCSQPRSKMEECFSVGTEGWKEENTYTWSVIWSLEAKGMTPFSSWRWVVACAVVMIMWIEFEWGNAVLSPNSNFEIEEAETCWFLFVFILSTMCLKRELIFASDRLALRNKYS